MSKFESLQTTNVSLKMDQVYFFKVLQDKYFEAPL